MSEFDYVVIALFAGVLSHSILKTKLQVTEILEILEKND